MTEVTAGASGTKVPEQRADDRADARDVDSRDDGRDVNSRDVGRGSRAGDRSGRGSVDERGERPLERADRNMIEMLQELRVAQTGVQILFAFLLSLSFTERFAASTTSSSGPTSSPCCSPP